MIICGHSYKKHFKYLSKLKQGDYVIFTDVLNNQYIYEVEDTSYIFYSLRIEKENRNGK